MLLLTLGTMVATVWAFTVVKKGFLPTEDTSIIIVRTEAQSDIAFQAMLERQRTGCRCRPNRSRRALRQFQRRADELQSDLNRGSIFVQLKPRHERAGRATITDVQHRLRRKAGGHRRHSRLPGAASESAHRQPLRRGRLSVHADQRRSGEALYRFRASSSSASRLHRDSPTSPATSTLGARQVKIEVDRDALARYGVSMETLRSTLYSTFGTRKIATVFTAANDYAVIVEADSKYQLDPSVLNRVFLRASTGQLIRFDSLARVTLGSGPIAVARQAQLPAVTVTFNLAPGFTLGEAVATMADVERDVGMPAGSAGSSPARRRSSRRASAISPS